MKLKHIIALALYIFSFCLYAEINLPAYPADVLDLTNWKITLPIDLDVNGSPDEIKQPTLATYSHAEYFHLNGTSNGVTFKAHAGGVTTSNSGYPRSELREMTNNGADMASWASNDGDYHILEVTEKITHTPDVKKHVVVAQIHDASDDIVMLRLENAKLFLEFNGTDGPAATTTYVLGTEFTFKIIVHNGVMDFYYNGSLFHTATQNFSGAYFKAGMYTQSSCQGSKQVVGELCTAYGEMELLGLSIYHGATLPTYNKESKIDESLFTSIQNGELTIKHNAGNATISIIDMIGIKYLKKEFTFTGEIDVVPLNINLPKGIYVISITQNKKNSSTKVIVN